jgi:hypothetical protein
MGGKRLSEMYPGVYPGSLISLILIGKINDAETNEQDFHSSPDWR